MTTDQPDDRGICGAYAPALMDGPTPICTLMAEHPGWHGDREGMSWCERAPRPPNDLDRFIAEQMHDPEFVHAWAAGQAREVQAAYERGVAEGQAEIARLQMLLEQAEQYARDLQDGTAPGLEEQFTAVHDRSFGEGWKLATEGWDREWGLSLHGHPAQCVMNEHAARGIAADPSAPADAKVLYRLVGPWEPAEQPGPCPSRIAHESGVVLACTVEHGEPRVGVHANVHHQVMWDDEDDRVLLETAAEQPEGGAR